jgi:hypothetical protein
VLPVLLWASTSVLGVVLFAILLRRSLVLEGTGSLAIFAMDRRRRRLAELGIATTTGTPLAPAAAATLVVAPDTEPFSPWAARPGREARRFDKPPGRGVERRTIGYRQVRISAGPDDVRTPEVGRVDRGDEIEVIGEDASFFFIRTPDGVEGWVPRFVILGI